MGEGTVVIYAWDGENSFFCLPHNTRIGEKL